MTWWGWDRYRLFFLALDDDASASPHLCIKEIRSMDGAWQMVLRRKGPRDECCTQYGLLYDHINRLLASFDVTTLCRLLTSFSLLVGPRCQTSGSRLVTLAP